MICPKTIFRRNHLERQDGSALWCRCHGACRWHKKSSTRSWMYPYVFWLAYWFWVDFRPSYLYGERSEGSRLWIAIFHAVSAFCNAGFSIFSDSLAAPDVASHVGVNLIVIALIVLGGLGFLVIWETLGWLRCLLSKQTTRLSVQ